MRILKVKTEKRSLGTFGEKRAARYLWLHGYRVRGRNYTGGEVENVELPEIDIIATKRDTAVYVEVKTRTLEKMHPCEVRPAAAVNREKMKKIMQTAYWYRAWHARGMKMRFDIIEVYVTEKNGRKRVAEIRHIVGAYNKNTIFGHVN